MRHSAPKFQLLVVLMIAALACPWSIALPSLEPALNFDSPGLPSFPVVRTMGDSVLKTSIDRTRRSSLIDEFAALAFGLEEDDESDDLKATSCSLPLDSFDSFSVNSPGSVSTMPVEPRSPKIHPVVRFCRLLC